MLRRIYHINPDTLRYEKLRISKKQLLIRGSAIALGLVALAVGLRFGFEQIHETPRQQRYTEENIALRQAYSELGQDLRTLETDLSDMQNRDDRLYRSILSLDPIPSSIRDAGRGGSVPYQPISGARDAGFVQDMHAKVAQLSSKLEIQSKSLETVYEEAVHSQEFLACRPAINPISPADPYWMTSSFGYRVDPFTKRRTPHLGIDLAGPYGLDIHATGGGKVVIAHDSHSGYGKEVVIDHGFGFQTRYAHLQDVLVKKGQEIQRGEVVGTLGSSGRSTGPHLHYEVSENGRAMNPMYYFFEDLDSSEYTQLAARAAEHPYQAMAYSQK
ncbi:MAG: M23 family metallopeptidase [Bacteroidales bacterium]